MRIREGIEDQAKLRRGLPHELGDQPIETDREQRQPQLASKDASRHRLPGPGRADQKEPTKRVKAVLVESVTLALLQQHPLELLVHLRVQGEIRQPILGVDHGQKCGEVAARSRNRHGQSTRPRAAPCRVDKFLEFLRIAGVTAPCFPRCHLKRDRVKRSSSPAAWLLISAFNWSAVAISPTSFRSLVDHVEPHLDQPAGSHAAER